MRILRGPAFSSANSRSAAASFSASSASRRLCSTVAEILSTSPDKAPLPLLQPASVRSSRVVAASSRSAISCSLVFHAIPFFQLSVNVVAQTA
jgi:hypothetical protein